MGCSREVGELIAAIYEQHAYRRGKCVGICTEWEGGKGVLHTQRLGNVSVSANEVMSSDRLVIGEIVEYTLSGRSGSWRGTQIEGLNEGILSNTPFHLSKERVAAVTNLVKESTFDFTRYPEYQRGEKVLLIDSREDVIVSGRKDENNQCMVFFRDGKKELIHESKLQRECKADANKPITDFITKKRKRSPTKSKSIPRKRGRSNSLPPKTRRSVPRKSPSVPRNTSPPSKTKRSIPRKSSSVPRKSPEHSTKPKNVFDTPSTIATPSDGHTQYEGVCTGFGDDFGFIDIQGIDVHPLCPAALVRRKFNRDYLEVGECVLVTVEENPTKPGKYRVKDMWPSPTYHGVLYYLDPWTDYTAVVNSWKIFNGYAFGFITIMGWHAEILLPHNCLIEYNTRMATYHYPPIHGLNPGDEVIIRVVPDKRQHDKYMVQTLLSVKMNGCPHRDRISGCPHRDRRTRMTALRCKARARRARQGRWQMCSEGER